MTALKLILKIVIAPVILLLTLAIWICVGLDPKTVQYLAGHESSKITMDIYAKVKYNRPEDLVKTMGCAFDLWDAV